MMARFTSDGPNMAPRVGPTMPTSVKTVAPVRTPMLPRTSPITPTTGPRPIATPHVTSPGIMIPTPLRPVGPGYSGPSGLSPASPIAGSIQQATGVAPSGGTSSGPLTDPQGGSGGTGLSSVFGGGASGSPNLLLIAAGVVVLILLVRRA